MKSEYSIRPEIRKDEEKKKYIKRKILQKRLDNIRQANYIAWSRSERGADRKVDNGNGKYRIQSYGGLHTAVPTPKTAGLEWDDDVLKNHHDAFNTDEYRQASAIQDKYFDLCNEIGQKEYESFEEQAEKIRELLAAGKIGLSVAAIISTIAILVKNKNRICRLISFSHTNREMKKQLASIEKELSSNKKELESLVKQYKSGKISESDYKTTLKKLLSDSDALLKRQRSIIAAHASEKQSKSKK